MVQLELDPKFMPGDRTPEGIEFYRGRILRVVTRGRRIKDQNFQPISLVEALSDLMTKSFSYFKPLSNRTDDIDQLVSTALTRALPYLEGKKGDFYSFGVFRNRMFISTILYHLAIDHHREKSRQQQKAAGIDSLPAKEVRDSRWNGFQPPLLSFKRLQQGLMAERVSNQLRADLQDPERILEDGDSKRQREKVFNSWDPGYLSSRGQHVQRALCLWAQNPALSSRGIVMRLQDEGLGEFTDSAVRVWLKRARDYHKHPNRITTQAV